MPKLTNETVMLAFVIVTAVALALQTVILFLIFLTLKKTATTIRDQVEDLRSSIMPVIYNTRELYSRFSELATSFVDTYSRVAPKVETAADDLAQITGNLRAQSAKMQSSVIDVVDRVRQQSERIDQMFTSVLDAVDRAGGFVAEMVSKPIRQIQGMLASVKAAIETLGQEEAQKAEAEPQPEPPSAEGAPTHSAGYGAGPETWV